MSRDWSKSILISSSWLVIGPLLVGFSTLIASEIGRIEALVFLIISSSSILSQQWWKQSLTFGGALIFFWTVAVFFYRSSDLFGFEALLTWGSGTSFLIALAITALSKDEAEHGLMIQQRLNQKELFQLKEALETEINNKNLEIKALENRFLEQQRQQFLQSQEQDGARETQVGLHQQIETLQRENASKRAEAMEYQRQQQVTYAQLQALRQQHEQLSAETSAVLQLEEKLKEREDQYRQTEHAYCEMTKDQESLNQIIATQSLKIGSLEHELEAKIAKIELIEKERHSLHNLISEQQKTHVLLQEITHERDRLRTELETKGCSSTLERELRRVQGLYKQLQEQFDEKSAILEETRKVLFLAEQMKEALQIELHEHQIEIDSESLRQLSEAHGKIAEQEKEIEALETLISSQMLSV